jgi:hypothetical protein
VQTKPYWRVIEQALHLGYRRRATGGTWIARRRDEHGIYYESKIGLADDLLGSIGIRRAQGLLSHTVLHSISFHNHLGQATALSREICKLVRRLKCPGLFARDPSFMRDTSEPLT